MRNASGCNLAIDVGLELQVRGSSIAFGIDWQGDVHLGDVHLHSESGEALDIGRDGRDIGVQVRNVHLESHAIDGNATLPEIANHGVDRVRLGIHGFRLGVVVKQESLRIGFMRPANTALDIGVAPPGEANSRLVAPDCAAQFSRMQLVEGLVDHVAGEEPATEMSYHGLDVFLKNFSELAGSVCSFCQPLWILPMPRQCVTANLDVVTCREIYDLVGLREIERLRLRMNHLPLE